MAIMFKYIARHGAMRLLGEFEATEGVRYARGQLVVLRTTRGLENGEILCDATVRSMRLIPEPTTGKIVRVMTDDDHEQRRQLFEKESEAYDGCTEFIRNRKLQMELVDVELLFGGERIVFYFLAEKRVDFRDLVKDLARQFRTRIEMRQIGVRDEAKLLADYGDCGKPVCCNTHMTVMPPVSMRMAKLQKSTLDPSKISGRCGRLKCCLRFEQDVYEKFQKKLPPPGCRVETNQGEARVLGQEILARKILVEFDDGRRILISGDDVVARIK